MCCIIMHKYRYIKKFILVIGGYSESSTEFSATKILDSTEILSASGWTTVTAKLPSPMYGLRISTINNRVLSFGNAWGGFKIHFRPFRVILVKKILGEKSGGGSHT